MEDGCECDYCIIREVKPETAGLKMKAEPFERLSSPPSSALESEQLLLSTVVINDRI